MTFSASLALLVASTSPVPADAPMAGQSAQDNAAVDADPAPGSVDTAALPASAPVSATPEAPQPPPQAKSVEDNDEDDDIVVTGGKAPPEDPLQNVNIQTYRATQAVDTAVVAPAASVYKKALPTPVRSGLRNFFNNLAEPVVFLNFMLQLKPGKAAETLGRFAINSTAGVGGLVDVAKRKPFKLPLRRNGFANTLGYYGVKPGPFLFLPLVGPTTIRDVIGLGIDRLILPTAVGKPFNQPYYAIPATLVGSLDYRVEFDEQLRKLHESPNPYAASREHYLKSRQAEIDALHGRVTPPPVLVENPAAAPIPAPAAAGAVAPVEAPVPANAAATVAPD